MLNSSVLDVAIGLVFVYLVLALLCTALNEWWSGLLGLRGKVLQDGIRKLLGGPVDGALVRAFYNSHFIQSITSSEGHPSYISPKTFAQGLVDALQTLAQSPATPAAPGQPTPPSPPRQSIQALVDQMPQSPTKSALRTVLAGVNTTEEAAVDKIAAWFEANMDRVSGWYKRKIQFVTLMMAALLALCTNADTLQIVHRLWTNPTLRASVVAQAQERAKRSGPSKPLDIEYKDSSAVATEPVKTNSGGRGEERIVTLEEERVLGDLLSWSKELCELNERVAAANPADPTDPNVKPCSDAKPPVDSNLHLRSMVKHPGVSLAWFYWLISNRLLGWLITVYAISLGAPFWFGLLQKLVNIRSAGDAPDEKKKPAESAAGGNAQ